MINLDKLEEYRENNRIEAKTALGGLPKSIWETYSAFANTLGGVILLGVQEYKDKSFHLVDLPDPEGMKQEFWNAVNDPKVASVNILSPDNIRIENVSGNHIIIIEIPRAGRTNRPVFVDGIPQHSYRRNGEGDYRCSHEEYQAMVRDASLRSNDMLVLEEMGMDVFEPESIHAFRQRMRISRPGHIWENLGEREFLLQIGAAAAGDDGAIHPVIGGLLMFGTEKDIRRVFPQYSPVYQTGLTLPVSRDGSVSSSSGNWSGNVPDFYFRVCDKLRMDLRGLKNGIRFDEGSLFDVIREALANCLVNADYFGKAGIRVIAYRSRYGDRRGSFGSAEQSAPEHVQPDRHRRRKRQRDPEALPCMEGIRAAPTGDHTEPGSGYDRSDSLVSSRHGVRDKTDRGK